MENFNLSCAYYPTTIVVVDDNQNYLKNIQYRLGRHNLCKAYSDPAAALDYINSLASKNALSGIVAIDESSEHYSHLSNQLPLEYDVSKIYQHVYDERRFEEISVVVVDYAMPSMNGEEFCQKLQKMRGNSIKVIMLTGEADDPRAIQLFNAGIIDKFLRKAQGGLDEDLRNAVAQMQQHYFQEITHPIMQALSLERDSSLGDPAFAEFFQKTCQDLSATSYYLIEPSGSFILFDDAGKPTWLIVKSLDELRAIADQMEPDDISESVIDSMMHGDVIPYFGSAGYACFSNEEKLKQCLHPAQSLQAKKDYRYSLINELPEFSLDKNKIISFREHMANL